MFLYIIFNLKQYFFKLTIVFIYNLQLVYNDVFKRNNKKNNNNKLHTSLIIIEIRMICCKNIKIYIPNYRWIL